MNLWPWTSAQSLMETFMPTALQAEGLVAVLASGLIMLVLGRTVLGARTLPEIALIAGWGLVCLVLTLWGVKTPSSMRLPAAVLIAVAAVSALTPRGQLSRSDLIALGRLLLVGLPLIAVLAAAYPTGPDTFTNQLPNAAYLYDYGQFPAKTRPPMLALWPAFPYNLQLATYIPTLLTPAFPPNVLTHVNLLFELAFSLLLARSLRGAQTPREDAPSWAATAAALLLTTFLNPGFDPKVQFSGYGDPTIAVVLAFAAWQAERLLAALAAERPAADERLALAFVLLAGAAIKQVSIFLMASVVFTAFLIGARDRRVGARLAFFYLIPALLPAALLVGVWRFYVSTHFLPDDELRFLSFGAWNFAGIPAILANMARHVWEHLPFFALLYGVTFAAVPLALRRGITHSARLFLLTAGVTLLYTAFLVFTYVAHFPGEIGESAHSFFRYNLHLDLLATLAIVAFARESWMRRGAPELGTGWRAVGMVAILLAFTAPVAGARLIRPDRREPEPAVWDLARMVAPRLQPGDHVALLLPGAGDNRSVAFMLRVAIAIDHPNSRLANFRDIPRADKRALDEAHAGGDNFALISCVPAALAESPLGQALNLPAGQAVLLEREEEGWRLVAVQPYLNMALSDRWTSELSPGPFCR